MPHIDDDRAFWSDDPAKWIREALKLPDNFGSIDDRFRHCEPDRTWALGPVILTRDSGLLDQSNSAAIRSMLESDPSLADDWTITGANHWACGWVDHLSFRVVEPDGTPTRVARVIKGFYDALSDYPIADESDFCQRESEACYKNIQDHRKRNMLRDDLPDSWVGDMIDWYYANDCSAVESQDDHGACPDDSEFEVAARALGFWDTSDEDSDDV